MTSQEEFNRKQAEMPDKILHKEVSEKLSKLCKTGGESFVMHVPPRVDDLDMLIGELLNRFKKLTQ